MDMRIAIDARIINSSTGRYVERLLRHLEEVDTTNEYTVLVRKKDENYYQPLSPRFKIMVADFADYSLGEQFGFLSFLNKLQPDLVHFCMPQQPILYKGKHVTTVHDLTLLKTYNSDKNWLAYHLKQAVGRFVFKRIGKTSAHIITPTQFTKDEYTKFANIPSDKVTVTYEAADINPAVAEPYEPMVNQQFIMYVGSQSDYKNIRRLVQAHQELLKLYPDLKLVLVGKLSGKNGASLRKNKQWIEKQKYDNVAFTDFVSDAQLAWLYQNTEAYVFPSLMEGFGLPALEAMACGAPVVSSNATCLPEVYGDAAYYFDPTDVTDITRKVNDVLERESLRDELIAKGLERVKLYSWRRMAEQTLEVYQNALGTDKPA